MPDLNIILSTLPDDVEDLVRLEDFVREVPDIESEARFTPKTRQVPGCK